jgi:hypothetical protein
MNKRWKPEIGQKYWCFIGYVKSKIIFYLATWGNSKLDNEIRNNFGVYKTKKEAILYKKMLSNFLNQTIGEK